MVLTYLSGGESEFQSILKGSKGLVCVDYFTTWCGPCKTIGPVFEQLSKKHSGLTFLKVDCDKHKAVAQGQGVRAFPTFMFYNAGTKVGEMKGANAGKLQAMVGTLAGKYPGFVSAFKRSGGGGRLNAPNPSNPKPTATSSTSSKKGKSAPKRFNPWANDDFVSKKLSKTQTTSEAKKKPTAPVQAKRTASNNRNPLPTTRKPTPTQPTNTSTSTTPVTTTTPSTTSAAALAGGANAVTANPVWVTQLVEMGFPREKAIRALQQVKNSSLDAAMNAMFSLPDAVAGDTPSSSITTSTAAPSQSNKAQSKLLAQHPDTKQAEPVTEAATATPNANAVEESLAELDPEAQAIFAKLQREKAAKSKARAAKPDAPPKKKTSEMTSEEKMEWLAQRREQVAKDKIKQKFQTVKEREMSRRNTAKAANTLRRKREEMEMEALKRARMKEKAEKKAAKKRIKERIAMEKERRKKEAARERARLDALKAAKAQQ